MTLDKYLLRPQFCKINGVRLADLPLKSPVPGGIRGPPTGRLGEGCGCGWPDAGGRRSGPESVRVRKALVPRGAPSAPPPAEPEEAELELSRLPSGEAAEEAARRAPAEDRAGRRGRLAGGTRSAGRAAPRGGRSRREVSAPCVRAEPGPCEPPT